MQSIGYTLSSEEHAAPHLAQFAQRAERAGFEFAVISDHYHPWTSAQGQSPFVWAMLGAIAQATSSLRVGTGVTCPIMRIHPAIIAQAAATTGQLFDGRFFLGVGAGENLNEHVTGERWPRPAERHDLLAEALDVIRRLWSGETISFRGAYYTVDEARLFSRPEHPPHIYVAASGPDAARLAAGQDGLIGTSPDRELLDAFRTTGGRKPAYGQLTVCYAATEQEARRTAHRCWRQNALSGGLHWELKTFEHVEAACQAATEDEVTRDIPCGPDPQQHLEAIRQFADAGYDHVYIHQVGPQQEEFFAFFERELRDRL